MGINNVSRRPSSLEGRNSECRRNTTTFCYLYKCTYRNFDEYPSLRTPDGSIKAQRCVYFGTHTTEVPDISHRCHKKRCIRIDHLVAEKRSQNNLRKACKSANVCLGPSQHDGLECVLNTNSEIVSRPTI